MADSVSGVGSVRFAVSCQFWRRFRVPLLPVASNLCYRTYFPRPKCIEISINGQLSADASLPCPGKGGIRHGSKRSLAGDSVLLSQGLGVHKSRLSQLESLGFTGADLTPLLRHVAISRASRYVLCITFRSLSPHICNQRFSFVTPC
jgi:hypothetical protein